MTEKKKPSAQRKAPAQRAPVGHTPSGEAPAPIVRPIEDRKTAEVLAEAIGLIETTVICPTCGTECAASPCTTCGTRLE